VAPPPRPPTPPSTFIPGKPGGGLDASRGLIYQRVPPGNQLVDAGSSDDGISALSQAYRNATGLELQTPSGLPREIRRIIPQPGGVCFTMAGNAMGVPGVMSAAALQAAADTRDQYGNLKYTTTIVPPGTRPPHPTVIPGATWHTDSHAGVVSGGTSYDFTQAATRYHNIPATVHDRNLNDVRNALSPDGSGRQPYLNQTIYIHTRSGQPVPQGYQVRPPDRK
jgi:hypothetical protein